MTRTLKAQSAPTDQCPEGVYAAKIAEIVDWESSTPSQYGNGPQLLWKFHIGKVVHANAVRPTKQHPTPSQPDDFVGQEVWGFTSIPDKLTPGTKLRQWIEGIEGRELDDNEDYDLDDLVGRKVAITIGRSQTGKQKVIQVTAYVAGQPVQAPMAVPEPEPEPEPVAASVGDFDDEDPF